MYSPYQKVMLKSITNFIAVSYTYSLAHVYLSLPGGPSSQATEGTRSTAFH